jgi:branched-chain amino acid transport system ATP-binding protein
MSSLPILETQNLGRKFGQLQVLSGFDLRVEAGEILGIIGPNGAGKSTLLSVLGGSVAPSTGKIFFEGDDVTRKSAAWRARHGIATSYQIPRPFVDMTVLENVLVAASFASALFGHQAQALAVSSLERAGLTAFSNEPASSLRLLDRKRLEVARALAANPRILLLDEIAGGLTEAEVPVLVELVRSVAASGVTVIWIEHVVHALTAVATRLLCLTYGKILAEGDPQEVLDSPEVRSVYLGMAPDDENEFSAAAAKTKRARVQAKNA